MAAQTDRICNYFISKYKNKGLTCSARAAPTVRLSVTRGSAVTNLHLWDMKNLIFGLIQNVYDVAK